jgi:hypothetical protein
MPARLVLALFAWLIATAALAQPVNTAYVDSREDCTALGGAWLAGRASWQSACAVPWERNECLRLHGEWMPVALAPNGGTCTAQVSQPAQQRQCTASGGTWGPPGSAMPFCQPSTTATKPPLRKASDANKACSGQNDCIYGCVYGGPPVTPGTTVQGHCRPSNRIEGCYDMVERGRLAGNICKK